MDFSKINPSEKPTLILRNLDGTAIQALGYAINVRINPYFNEISELSFELPAMVDGVPTPNYALVVGMRIVEVADVGQFILVDPEENDDGVVKKKNCKAYSLEYEFAKKDIYIPEGRYKFYDALAPENTILGMILEKMPDWRIGDISGMDHTKYRSFGEVRNKVYNFIKSDVQETFGCIFDFDTMNRRINVIGVETELPTKKVALTTQRLLKKVHKSEDSDGIITCLDVNGAEGVNIRSVNPTGKNVIYNLDYFLNTDNFSQELIDKWRSWEMAVEASRGAWKASMRDYNMRSMADLTQQAALTDLMGELTDLENQQAVTIQAIQRGLKKQSDLDAINMLIQSKNHEIQLKQDEILSIRIMMDADQQSMKAISSGLDFENPENGFFTPEELTILRRYFIEDSLEDSSFEVDAVSTYQDTPYIGEVSICEMVLECADEPGSAGGYIDFGGGSIRLTCGAAGLSAKIESAVLYLPDSSGALRGNFILTASTGEGWIGGRTGENRVEFTSGSLTMTGTYAQRPTVIKNNSGNVYQVTLKVNEAELYFTKTHTSYEVMTVEEALYEYGKQVLSEKAFPAYHFEVESGDFLTAEGFEAFKNEFALGTRVYLLLGEDEEPIKPYVVGAEIQYGSPGSTKLEFSSDYTSADRSFALAKLLEQSVSLGKTLSSKSGVYASFVESGASSSVKQFMESALDVAKNKVLSSRNQAIEFGDAGIRVRKWKDADKTGYEPEEVWIVDNTIAFTDDNWATAKMALGKIVDENLKRFIRTQDASKKTGKTYYVDQYGKTEWKQGEPGMPEWSTELYELDPDHDGTAYGIVAPYIVGTMLAGQNLVIDTGDGTFRVDGSGVHINALKMLITHEEGEGAQTTETLSDRLRTIADNEGALGLSIEELSGDVSKLTTTYYSDAVPTNPNNGDLWFVTDDVVVGGTVRYKKDRLYRYNGVSGVWNEIKDAEYLEAFNAAKNAQAAADGKIQTFRQDTEPSNASYGDYWFNTAAAGTSYTRTKRGNRPLNEGDVINVPLYLEFQGDLNYDGLFRDSGGNCGDVIRFSKGRLYTETVPGANTLQYVFEDAGKHRTVICVKPIGFDEGVWKSRNVSLHPSVGTVTKVNRDIPIYFMGKAAGMNAITYTIQGQKLYRFDGLVWELIEDGEIRLLDESVKTINNSLSDLIIKEGETTGYLKAEKLAGYIDSSVSKMKSQRGNVLFDSDGIWLLDNEEKATSTMGVWLGERGIAFGKLPDGSEMTSDPANGWKWKTFIGHDGVAADALASTYLSSIHILGGDIQIGNNFKVDKDGNLTAKNGTFTGTLDAPILKRKLQADEEDGAWLIGAGISVGPGADECDGNFYVDPEGNVTMKGSILLDGNITWSADSNPVRVKYSEDGTGSPSDENWHDTLYPNDNYVIYSYDGGRTWTSAVRFRGEKGDQGDSVNLNEYGIIKDTYLDETKILSPMIVGGHFYATGQGKDNEAAYYICNGINTSEQLPSKNLAYISYDTTGAGTDDDRKERIIFRSIADEYNEHGVKISPGIGIKIIGGIGLSLAADSGGKIYLDSDVKFKRDTTIDFAYANVTGLTATFG